MFEEDEDNEETPIEMPIEEEEQQEEQPNYNLNVGEENDSEPEQTEDNQLQCPHCECYKLLFRDLNDNVLFLECDFCGKIFRHYLSRKAKKKKKGVCSYCG